MEAKLRIMTIRLMDKLEAQPACAKRMGVQGSTVFVRSGQSERPK